MKKQSVFLSLILLLSFVSCVDQTPVVYNSVIGNWRCEEHSMAGSRVYSVEILKTKNASNLEYAIFNFHNVDNNEAAIATLSGTKMTINENQPVGFSQINVLSGSGNVIGTDFKRMEFNYTIFDGKTTLTITTILTR